MGELQRRIVTTLVANNGALCVAMLCTALGVGSRRVWTSVQRLAATGTVRITRRRAYADQGALVELTGASESPLAGNGTVEVRLARPEAP